MRRSLLTTVAVAGLLLASNSLARAADPSAPATDWSGVYIGVHGGYGGAFAKGCVDCTGTGENIDLNDLNLDGLLGGAQAGVNFQSGSIVYGLEGDLSFMNWDDVVTDDSSPADGSNDAVDINLLASVRGRLGIAMDDVLVYATGGLAFADAEGSLLNSLEPFDVNFNELGGVAGGGIEWAYTDQMRFRAEGLYYYFGDKESVDDAHSGAAGENFEFKDAVVARVGVSWFLN